MDRGIWGRLGGTVKEVMKGMTRSEVMLRLGTSLMPINACTTKCVPCSTLSSHQPSVTSPLELRLFPPTAQCQKWTGHRWCSWARWSAVFSRPPVLAQPVFGLHLLCLPIHTRNWRRRGKSVGHPANPVSSGKWSLKCCVCMCVQALARRGQLHPEGSNTKPVCSVCGINMHYASKCTRLCHFEMKELKNFLLSVGSVSKCRFIEHDYVKHLLR